MIIKTDSELYRQIRRSWLESNDNYKHAGSAKNCRSFFEWIQQQHATIHFCRTYYPHRQLLRDQIGLVEGVDYIEFYNEKYYNIFVLKYC